MASFDIPTIDVSPFFKSEENEDLIHITPLNF